MKVTDIIFSSPLDIRNDFETHLKYVSRVAALTNSVSLSCGVQPKLSKDKLNTINGKLQLIKLTKQSIDDEYKIVQIDSEYSNASVLWLPIKTYYLVFHLLCVIDYILSGNEMSLLNQHSPCIRKFTNMLKKGEIFFGLDLLNKTFDKDILKFKTKSGEHLKSTVSDDVLYSLIMKKSFKERVDVFKRLDNINGRTTDGKQKISKMINSTTVSVFDYFYVMRMRTNYRDFSFIKGIEGYQTKEYFEAYYFAAGNLYSCLTGLVNELVKIINKQNT